MLKRVHRIWNELKWLNESEMHIFSGKKVNGVFMENIYTGNSDAFYPLLFLLSSLKYYFCFLFELGCFFVLFCFYFFEFHYSLLFPPMIIISVVRNPFSCSLHVLARLGPSDLGKCPRWEWATSAGCGTANGARKWHSSPDHLDILSQESVVLMMGVTPSLGLWWTLDLIEQQEVVRWKGNIPSFSVPSLTLKLRALFVNCPILGHPRSRNQFMTSFLLGPSPFPLPVLQPA